MNENYEPILIEIEQDINLINNNSCLRSSLSGLDYAKYLRREQKRTAPIIFTSFLPINYLLAQPRTKILTTIGHDYLQMPYSDQALKAMQSTLKPLNDIQLQDIIINFCGLRSAVRESFHAFKGEIRVIKADVLDKKERYQNLFDAYRTELMKDVGDYPEIIHAYDEMIAKYNPEKEDSIDFILMEQEERFVRFLPPEENNSNETHSEKKPWKVLFLDDKPTELTPIHTILNNRGIQYEVVQSSQEAKEAIEADVLNQITVVVADYRLLESTVQDGWNEPKMQPEQGYDFLLWLSKQDRYNAMVALSGLSKWFLMDSFRRKQMNVKVYSKGGVLGGGAASFVDDLEYLGAQYNEIINNQPQALLWTMPQYVDKEKTKIKNNPLKPYYVHHRNHNNYLTNDSLINQQAEKVAREVEFAIDQSSNFNFASLVSIQGNTTKTLQGEIEKGYPNFLVKLLQRRVFYYLLLKGFERDAITKMLHKGDSKSEMKDSMIKAVPNMLAIQTETDIPYHLLVEEKYFLHHYMGLPIYDIAEMMDQTHSIINAVLTQSLKNHKNITDVLKNYCFDNNNQLYFSSVSMYEAHIIVGKVVDLLVKQNKIETAQNLILKIEVVLNGIQKLVPKHKKMNFSIGEISKLIDKIKGLL